MLKSIFCLFGKHSIARDRVWHDGFDYRTTCLGCNKPLIRDVRVWRLFDDEADTKVARDPHPKSEPTE
jgi:hypothetical protein